MIEDLKQKRAELQATKEALVAEFRYRLGQLDGQIALIDTLLKPPEDEEKSGTEG